MLKIPLLPIPNQRIEFNADSAYWSVRIFQAIDHMCADISRGGAVIASGIRCFSGIPLMPYEYMYLPNFGNLIFDGNPDWEMFDGRVNLFYLNPSELVEYNKLFYPSGGLVEPVIVPKGSFLDGTWKLDGSRLLNGLKG